MSWHQPNGIFHEFAIGDLVLYDEVLAAYVLRRGLSYGIPVYDLQTEAGIIERNIVGGYLRAWPESTSAPRFHPLRRW